jgi:3-isopropylmalate/(R)-2-methylmalate dehydratase small subunit
MEPFRKLTGVAAPLILDDINTDQIIPTLYLRQLHADLSEGLFGYMRKLPNGESNQDFVLEKPQYRTASILLVGSNFGCGSSREHAAWAMLAFGIRCVIGRSHAEYFRENCIRNGILPITLDDGALQSLEQAVNDINGAEDFTVDLEQQTITGPAGQEWPFSIAPFERVTLLEGLDEIGITLKHADAIGRWEAETRTGRPLLQRLDI